MMEPKEVDHLYFDPRSYPMLHKTVEWRSHFVYREASRMKMDDLVAKAANWQLGYKHMEEKKEGNMLGNRGRCVNH